MKANRLSHQYGNSKDEKFFDDTTIIGNTRKKESRIQNGLSKMVNDFGCYLFKEINELQLGFNYLYNYYPLIRRKLKL